MRARSRFMAALRKRATRHHNQMEEAKTEEAREEARIRWDETEKIYDSFRRMFPVTRTKDYRRTYRRAARYYLLRLGDFKGKVTR